MRSTTQRTSLDNLNTDRLYPSGNLYSGNDQHILAVHAIKKAKKYQNITCDSVQLLLESKLETSCFPKHIQPQATYYILGWTPKLYVQSHLPCKVTFRGPSFVRFREHIGDVPASLRARAEGSHVHDLRVASQPVEWRHWTTTSRLYFSHLRYSRNCSYITFTVSQLQFRGIPYVAGNFWEKNIVEKLRCQSCAKKAISDSRKTPASSRSCPTIWFGSGFRSSPLNL